MEKLIVIRIETENIAGGLLQRSCKTPPSEFGINAFTCSMEVANFDSKSSKILSLGGQGYFMDPGNNVFEIFEADVNVK